MGISTSICQGPVSPVFDVASRLTVARLKARAEQERKEVAPQQSLPQAIARSLATWGIDLMNCGGISQKPQVTLESADIKVLAHTRGEVESFAGVNWAGRLHAVGYTKQSTPCL